MPKFRLIKTPRRRRKYPALIQAVTRPRGGGGGGGAIDASAGLMNSGAALLPFSAGVVIQARCCVRVCVFACVHHDECVWTPYIAVCGALRTG